VLKCELLLHFSEEYYIFVVKLYTCPVDRETLSAVCGYTPALRRPATADWKPAL
jgi:hypothetical protein